MSYTKIDGEFWECESCRSKPGTPALCESCLHNRKVISDLQWSSIKILRKIKEIIDEYD